MEQGIEKKSPGFLIFFSMIGIYRSVYLTHNDSVDVRTLCGYSYFMVVTHKLTVYNN